MSALTVVIHTYSWFLSDSPITGCSIIDNPGQLVDIYDVSLSTETEVIQTFQMQNALEIDNGESHSIQVNSL